MAILITGGAGFIGRTLARHFVAAGRDVLAFDMAPPEAATSADWPAGVGYVSGDIRDPATVRAAVERSGGQDPIVHLASMLTAG